jgi:tyrosinase
MDIRSDIANFKGTSGDPLDKFVNAILELKKMPSKVTNSGSYTQPNNRYDDFVFMHIVSFASQEASTMIAHGVSTFLPWHRIYLRLFEKELQNIDPTKYGDVTIPYWDWTNPESTKRVFETMGGNGRDIDGKVMDGIFAYDGGDWELYTTKLPGDERQEYLRPFLTRKLGFYKMLDQTTLFDLPSKEDVLNSLKIDVYDKPEWNNEDTLNSFRNYLEGGIGPGLHNLVHGWVGGSEIGIRPGSENQYYYIYRGTMGNGGSPNDPIFWLHHSNIDRIWADWQLEEKHWNLQYKGYLPKEGVQFLSANDPMSPWYGNETPAKAANFYSFGYKYDRYIRPEIKDKQISIDEKVSDDILSEKLFSDETFGDLDLKFLDESTVNNLNNKLLGELFPLRK